MNGKIVRSVENDNPLKFSNVQVWATTPGYSAPPSKAMIRNLVYGSDLGIRETLFKMYGSDVKVQNNKRYMGIIKTKEYVSAETSL